MKHVNNTYNTYLKSTNELQGVLESDFTTFEVDIDILTFDCFIT